MSGKCVRRAIEGLVVAGLAALLVMRVYVVQELLAALVLFSVGCAAAAFLGLALFLLDELGQTLLFKLRGAIRPWTILAHRLPVFRDGTGRQLSLVVLWGEAALDVVSVRERLRRTGSYEAEFQKQQRERRKQ